MTNIKFDWVMTDIDCNICKMSDFELGIYAYDSEYNPCLFCVSLTIKASDDINEPATSLFGKDNIDTYEEAKKIIEAEFLRYWAKLKSEIENE
jgi:hypothetical protein